MSALRRHGKWLVAALLVAAAALVFVLRGRPSGTPPAGPTTPAVVDVEVGEYYDWSRYEGPLYKDVTMLVAEPLFEKSAGGYDVSRLATDARYEDGKATVTLRESARWSDGTPLEASQVVDGFARAKGQAFAGSLPAITLRASGPRELVVEGLKSKEDMSLLLQSRVLMPVRADLIASGKDAFKVTIGPYVPTQIVTTFKSDANIVLEPNPYYYRGAKGAPLSLGVAALVAAQKGGG